MNVTDIRPHSTYIGNGGVTRSVQFIYMTTEGRLVVRWKAVRPKRQLNEVATDVESLEQFADWAKAIKDTRSRDLQHHFSR
ncbi:hypothetical protein HFRIS_020040 [Herbaspirillum frisingense GSF30]|uniref:Uncharacterized protein n=1 Tax=Herbaspirillum frisingense GSF30 TaxID=864073 RepID=A0AAI9IBJ8_9BURK|nr:hypothetical protein HFRIS_020040 [Herbaspirillum frisingense GSF30]